MCHEGNVLRKLKSSKYGIAKLIAMYVEPIPCLIFEHLTPYFPIDNLGSLLRLLEDIATAIKHFHENDIVHQNICLGSIMYRVPGSWVLIGVGTENGIAKSRSVFKMCPF